MREIDDEAQATKDCSRCGGRAFYWRTAVVAGNRGAASLQIQAFHQPAWTCMNCGYIEPHDRRATPRAS
jgi:predicted nucleic-acid-binding Zn-ribbon protein